MKNTKKLVNFIFFTVLSFFMIGCSLSDSIAPKSSSNEVSIGRAIIAPSATGEVTFSTSSASIAVGDSFTTELHVNSGSQKLAAYGFVISYDATVVSIDTTKGSSGVVVGPDGFVAAVNNTSGKVNVSGFDTAGKGPGSDLNVFSITWKALKAGSPAFAITINNLVDASTAKIGTPKATIGSIVIGGGTTLPPITQPPATPVSGTDGLVSIIPSASTVDVNSSFTTQITVNSSSQKLAAYSFTIAYDSSLIELDKTKGSSGISAGPDGFLSASNDTGGKLQVSGFDTAGKGPGANLNVLTIYWKAKNTNGTVNFQLTIGNLVDDKTTKIGTPTAKNASVTISGGVTPPPATPTPVGNPGDVSIIPSASTVSANGSFTTQIAVNSGSQKLAAYSFTIAYNSSLIELDKTQGTSGVSAGPDGFLSASNDTGGKLQISGFDTAGKGPGASLNVLTIYWKAKNTNGTVNFQLTIGSLVDSSTAKIGTPTAKNASITITGGTIITPPPVTTQPPITPPPVTPTPPPATGNFSATWDQSSWNNGATVNLIIKNNGSSNVNGWTITWNFLNGEKISQIWNASYTQNGATVTAKNLDYNATISPNGTANLGFNLSHNGTTTKPKSITVNGTTVPIQ